MDHHGDAPEPEACAYISGGPVGPTLECEQEHPRLKAWATSPTLPEQSPKAWDTSDHPRAPQDAPSQPGGATQHPLHPQNLSTHFKSLNLAPFGLVSLQHLPSSLNNIPNKFYCAQDAFPMQATSADPQQSDARWSRTGRSEIGLQQMEVVSMTRFRSFQRTDHPLDT